MSQLTTYRKCGERFRLERLAKAPQRPAAWTIGGTAFHAAAEFYELTGGDPVPVFLEVYDAGIVEAHGQEPELSRWLRGGKIRTEKDIENRRTAGVEQVSQYVEHSQAAPWRIWRDPNGTPGIEYEFRVQFGRVEVLGYIDQVLEWPDGQITVRDLKTGAAANNQSIQLATYGFALRDLWQIPIGFGDFYMAKTATPTRFYDLSIYEKLAVQQQFESMDFAERSGVYLPNPGDGCFACGVKDHCAASRVALVG